MMKEKTIRKELAGIIKDLRSGVSQEDIVWTTAYACCLSETLIKGNLYQKIYKKYLGK
tara:strand:- start:168 stop:341 length:174 start_codon:yes stop_codon:yes gene_type:complete